MKTRGEIEVKSSCGKKFKTLIRIDTDAEYLYWLNDGILVYVLKNLLKEEK